MDPCDLPRCFEIGVDPVAVHLGSFALYWYGLLVAASLPYLWLLVATDGSNAYAIDGAYLLGTPLWVLFVPSVSFADRIE